MNTVPLGLPNFAYLATMKLLHITPNSVDSSVGGTAIGPYVEGDCLTLGAQFSAKLLEGSPFTFVDGKRSKPVFDRIFRAIKLAHLA